MDKQPEATVVFEESEADPISLDQTRQEIANADTFAQEWAHEVAIESMDVCWAAFDSLFEYAENKIGKEGLTREYLNSASPVESTIVGSAIGIVTKYIPFLGTLINKGVVSLMTGSAPMNPVGVAAALKAQASRERAKVALKLPDVLDANKETIRKVWVDAQGGDGVRRAAAKRAMAEIGIAKPAADTAAHIYEELVATLNIDAWVSACRDRRIGRTADCATDADVPKLKEQAHEEAVKTFDLEEGKKQAVPRG